MVVFKNYADLMKKQFVTVIIYIAIMISLIWMLANTTQRKTFTGFDQTKVNIAFFDYDNQSELVHGLIEYLKEYCEFVKIKDTPQDKMDALMYRNVYYIITIPRGFTDQFISQDDGGLQIDALEDTKEANYVNQAVKAYLNYARLYCMNHKDATASQIAQYAHKSMTAKTTVMEEKSSNGNKNQTNRNYYYNLLGYILMVCLIMTVCTSMTAYREENISKRHQVLPMTSASMNGQLFLGSIAYSCFFCLIFLALTLIISNEHDFTVTTLLFWINAFIYTIAMTVFAYFISYILKNKWVIIAAGNLTGLFLALISGVFIRQEYLGKGLMKAASFSPVYWFVYGNDLIMKMQEVNLDNLLKVGRVYGIELLFAAGFFCVGLAGQRIQEVRQ